MMRLDFWTWPLPVVNVGPNILLLLRAKLTCSGVGNDTTQERYWSFSVRWFLWVRCVQSLHGRTPNIPLHGIQKAPRPPLCPSSPRRNHHQCHHRLRQGCSGVYSARIPLAVGSVSRLG